MSEQKKQYPSFREDSICPCKSRLVYSECCLPLHQGKKKPDTAEQLMRSRFSAYFFRLTDYLVSSTHPDAREPNLKTEIAATIDDFNWRFLTIVSVFKGGVEDKVGKVEFIAEYFYNGNPHELHERSRFRRYKGVWKYLDDKG